jgi:MYXO-CTERM domain-containing protein
MKLSSRRGRTAIAITGMVVVSAVIAGTLIQLDAPVVVSTSDPANNAFKAKMGWISYKSAPTVAQYDVKAQLLVYADGPAGAQNIWIARSTDDGATWAQTRVTSNGGNAISVTDPVTLVTEPFVVTNNKPNIFVPPIGVLNAGKGANALLTWTSSDCEGSAAQKINTNLVPLTGKNQPYMCLWAARSTDGGANWLPPQRLTDGSMDPDEDVPAGSVQYTSDTGSSGHFAISYQADPKGLQLGDAEGSGDGASGANVSPGTNIWYTYLSKAAFEAGTAFPAAVQVSDNTSTATGAPGASRANLAISGSTAIMAYEETKGDGTSGKQIIYHSFPASTTTLATIQAGTGISNTANNARRVRFLVQGNEALDPAGDRDGDAADGDTKGVHVLLLWRETTLTTAAAASDVVVRRGIKNTALRPGSTGFLATDVLADTAINLSDPGAASLADNSLAQRGVLRGDFAAIAYDMTPNKAAADATPPTATYNLYVKRSTDGGDTWSAARQMSNVTDPAIRVVEPRLVGTPGTIKLPNGTATADASDVQDRNVMFVSWGTETNSATPVPLDIYITRTIDQGVNYERVQMLAEGVTEQSEAQLRAPPDGKTLGALWMQRDATTGAVDVFYRNGSEITGLPDPDLNLTATGASFAANGQGQVTFTILNQGAGDARHVVLTGTAPAGLTIAGTSDATLCSVKGAVLTCTIPEILAGGSRAISLNVTSATEGTYALAATVSGDVVETDAADNAATATVTVSATVAPTDGTVVSGDDGSSWGGCAAATGQMPFDPVLPLLAALGLAGLGVRRLRRN